MMTESVNLKFNRAVTVDCEDSRAGEVYGRAFCNGQILRDVTLEEVSKNFSNIHFENGDLAIAVPSNSFKIL